MSTSSLARLGHMVVDVTRIIYIRENRSWGYDTTYDVRLDGYTGELRLDYKDGPILMEFWERYKADQKGEVGK